MKSAARLVCVALLTAYTTGCVSNFRPAVSRSDAVIAATEPADLATPLGDDGTTSQPVRKNLWRTEHRVPTAAIVGTAVVVGLALVGLAVGAVVLSQHAPADGACVISRTCGSPSYTGPWQW